MTTVQLKIPIFVQRDLDSMTAEYKVSPEQFILIALAEKIAQLKTLRDDQVYNELVSAARGHMRAILDRAPDVPPMPGDEIPPEILEKLRKRDQQS